MEPQKGIKEAYNWADKTDAWEAYKVFRSARSLFFWLILLGLVIAEVSFWLVDRGMTGGFPARHSDSAFVESGAGQVRMILATEERPWKEQPVGPLVGGAEKGQGPDMAQVLPEGGVDEPVQEDEASRKARYADCFVCTSLTVWNYVLTFLAVVYCLSLLIGLKMALVGRFGGLAEATKAFFVSLIVMVLIVPWQQSIGHPMLATLFSYAELSGRYFDTGRTETFVAGLAYYWRFVGVWGLTVLLLLVAQIRSQRGAKIAQSQLTASGRNSSLEVLKDFGPAEGD